VPQFLISHFFLHTSCFPSATCAFYSVQTQLSLRHVGSFRIVTPLDLYLHMCAYFKAFGRHSGVLSDPLVLQLSGEWSSQVVILHFVLILKLIFRC